MEMSLGLSLTGLNEMEKRATSRSRSVLFKSMVKMESLAKHFAPSDRGQLRNRIHLSPQDAGYSEYTLSDGVEYGIDVEYGTSPHFVPIEPLKGWARRNLGDENAAYAVRAKIAKLGTNAQPFFRPALHEVQYKWLPNYKSQEFDFN